MLCVDGLIRASHFSVFFSKEKMWYLCTKNIDTIFFMTTLNIVLPTCWRELTATQLRYVFFLLSQNYAAEEVKTFCLCRFGGLKVLERTATGFRVLYDNQYLLIYQGTTKELPRNYQGTTHKKTIYKHLQPNRKSYFVNRKS